jgi:hypothetical protein
MGPIDRSRRRARVFLASGLVVVSMALGALPAGVAPGGGGGGGGPTPAFTLSPTSLSYSTPIGTSQVHDVTLTAGKKMVAIQTSATGAFTDNHAGTCWATYEGHGLTVPANASCTIQVQFSPTQATSYAGALTVTSCAKWTVSGGVIVCSKVDASTATSVSLSGDGTAPDLTISALTLGDGITPHGYNLTVTNIGNGAADLTSVGAQGYFEPTAAYNSTSGTGACGASFNPGTILAAGASTTLHVGCSGDGAAGDKYLVVRIDNSNALAEGNETNNDFAKPLVDFTIDAVSVQGADGSHVFNHTVTVKNVGAAAFGGNENVVVRGYLSPNAYLGGPGEDRNACFYRLTSSIAAGASETTSVPCDTTPIAGENYLILVADGNPIEYEAREANNAFAVLLPKDDLTITAVTNFGPSGAFPINYDVTVKVDGTLPIETSEILIAGVWSEDDVYANGADNPACNGLMPTDQLSDGETMVVSFSCSGPGPAPTDQYLVVKVDVGDPEWVAESDETNNEFAFLLP